MKTIAVIGSGFGGLAEAIRLQAAGFQVTIFEKREQVGGRAYQLVKDGYTFDMGPSLITAPFIIDAVFQAAGKRMEDYIDIVPLDPFYRIYFHDGTFLDYNGDSAKMKAEIAKFSEADAARYDDFFAAARGIYDAVITDGLGSRPFGSISDLFRFLPKAVGLKSLKPVYSFASDYFTHPNIRFAFSFHPLFIGGSPFRAPAIYAMIPYLEREAGVWFSKGGMYSLVRAFERVFLEIGGRIETNAEVSEIVVEDGRATGVRLHGAFHAADAVVSNGDVPWVYKHLIKPEHRRKWTDRKIDGLHIAMSVFLLYIGVKKQYPQLKHHTLILSERYRDLIEDIFDRKILADDFSMYLHVPTRSDASMAPEGCESMYLLVPVPHLGAGIDWRTQAEPFTQKLLAFLEDDFGLEDFRANIEVLEQFTPLDFEATLNSQLGNAFSIEPRLTQTAYFRPHNRREDVKGLYIVGAGTHPGGGVPGVLLSAETTEFCIREDFGLPV